MYADLSNMPRNISSNIPHVVGVKAIYSPARDVISWRQSKTTGDIVCEKPVVRQFARANIGIFAGTHPELDTTNPANLSEMENEPEGRKLHKMAKLHDF